jgi:probable rRNA maturation factor
MLTDAFECLTPVESETDTSTVLDVQLYVQEDLGTHQVVQDLCHRYKQWSQTLLLWMNHHDLWEAHGLHVPPESEAWCIDYYLVDNATIQAMNLEHRQKDAPTDVLSFPVFENAEGDDHAEETSDFSAVVQALPDALKALLTKQGGSLGSVVVSLDYAETHSKTNQGETPCLHYLMERLIHGSLHVLGVHHATTEDYERVIALQADFMKRMCLSDED